MLPRGTIAVPLALAVLATLLLAAAAPAGALAAPAPDPASALSDGNGPGADATAEGLALAGSAGAQASRATGAGAGAADAVLHDVPEVRGHADIVGRAASLLADEPDGLGAEELRALVAEQHLRARVDDASGDAWSMLRQLPEVPPLPTASVVAPAAPLRDLVTRSPEARTAATLAGSVVVAGAVALAFPQIPVLPLYSRIEREETMLNRRRAQLYQIVRDEPGIHLSDLVRRTGLGWGAALYHLSVLEKHRMVVVRNEDGFKRYFANGAHARDEMPRIAALRHGSARALFEAVMARPGRSARELRGASGLSPSSLARATDRLERAGLITRVRAGRRMLYFPAQPEEAERAVAAHAAGNASGTGAVAVAG